MVGAIGFEPTTPSSRTRAVQVEISNISYLQRKSKQEIRRCSRLFPLIHWRSIGPEERMPQASEELRALMNERFGDPIDETGPVDFLISRGYTLGRDWHWSKPGVTALGQMTRDEFEALMFLVHEWDFGGLRPDADPARALAQKE